MELTFCIVDHSLEVWVINTSMLFIWKSDARKVITYTQVPTQWEHSICMTCVISKNVIELRAVEDDQMFCEQKEMKDEASIHQY